ncbi:thiol reductant ABC exporter subunit CydC [Specibacter cremeus]|uniref:thiol reductant ABC exporter subunit CydC n=1 Tax=Specibacter cremeus TaxID=1629051 RepID=UPI000F783667|nr:thiol reductant ABC exporter subunit CydC [Specibacter cremeus]
MSPRPHLPSGRPARLALAALAGLAALKAAALVVLMGALAQALAALAGGRAQDAAALAIQGGAGTLMLGAAVWGQQVAARRAALGTKEELRARLLAHRLTGHRAHGDDNAGAEGMLASRGLDGLDNYFTTYLPALVGCAVLPLLIGVRILVADWVSALVIVLTAPLVPVFMVLIGHYTQDRVAAAARGLDRLSTHLLELAHGLPVLVGLRRATAQRRALTDISDRYRQTTMATLRTAFLSAMALELITTISVAVVAVFIGVRLVGGAMGLEAGLLALMLAPECFRPLRDVGAAHHGSEDGVEALRRVGAILADESPVPVVAGTDDGGAYVVRARQVTLAYPGRTEPALAGFSLELPRGGTAVLSTASGTGKSTALAVLAGLLPPTAGTVDLPAAGRTVWVAQHPAFTEELVRDEVSLYAAGPDQAPVPAHAVAAALAAVNAAHLADRPVADCSPGELRRVAVARALARIVCDPAVELALFDEPTAHLDPASAALVRAAVAGLRGSVAVVVATHDRLLSGQLGGSAETGGTPATAEPAPASSAPLVTAGTSTTIGPADTDAGTGSSGPVRFRWRWLCRLPLASARFAAGVVVAALATLSAAALSGISGWLIVWASWQPPMMYLMTLIVGVRAFGIGRSVLRYAERLLVHDAVLRWTTTLRVRLWDALAGNVGQWGKLTRTGGALGTLVADVDELRDALPRAIVPLPAAVLSYAAILAVTAWLLPGAAVVVWVAGPVTLVALPLLVWALQRRAAAASAVHRSWLAGRATTLLGAADQLAVNGVGTVQAQRFRAGDLAVSGPLRRVAWTSGLGQAGVSVLTGAAAVAVTLLAVAGRADARAAAVAALLMLALAEPLGMYVAAIGELPVMAAMMKRTMPLLDTPPTVIDGGAPASGPAGRVRTLRLDDVSARYPGAAGPVFTDVSGGVGRGSWWAVTGPSGSGKSTLLAVLLGFLPPERGRYTLGGAPAAGPRLAQVAWCPQEPYLFNSTLRANLALARPAGDAPADGELTAALATVGLGPWFAALPDGLDTRVGPGGHNLSGGQRSRVSAARTLVAGAAVVLLDEPTAHLGADESAGLIADLRGALAGTAVVLVTHDAGLVGPDDAHLSLGEPALGEAATLAR